MNNTLLTFLSLSISGSVLALTLLALRPVMKNKVSKTFQYYIWLLVLLRLALPLSLDDSIMNRIVSRTALAQASGASTSDDGGQGQFTQADTASQDNEQYPSWEVTPSETALNGSAAPNSDPSASPAPTRVNIGEFILDHLTFLWLLGAVLYLGWFGIAYLRFNGKIKKTSIRPHARDMEVFARLRGDTRVQLCCNPYINTPMLMGLLFPRILIPHRAFVVNGMKPELEHILRHELTHYRRRDLLYKWFTIAVSSLHWFNPLMVLMRREIGRACELSCDEAVICSMNTNERQDYGETLLALALNKPLPAGIVTTTMCEGKHELKERLESIMKYKGRSLIMFALSLTLALVIAGCSMALGAAGIPDAVASPSPTAANTPSAAASPSPAPSDSNGENTADSILESYSAVLQNKGEFFSTDNKKDLFLDDFLSNKEIYGTVFTVTHFSVLDMNGDTVPEVVLELSVGNEPQFYEVLHEMNGVVYGYLVGNRSLIGLKADGSFGFSSGAADSGWGKMIFGSAAFTIDKAAYSESRQGDDALIISYYIDDEPVTGEAFDSLSGEQSQKTDAVWHEFSQTNIDADLSGNP